MEKGREQGTENGLGAAGAKRKSAKPATGAPVTASGCKQWEEKAAAAAARPGPRGRGESRWYHGSFMRFRPCGQLPAEDGGAFFVLPAAQGAEKCAV